MIVVFMVFVFFMGMESTPFTSLHRRRPVGHFSGGHGVVRAPPCSIRVRVDPSVDPLSAKNGRLPGVPDNCLYRTTDRIDLKHSGVDSEIHTQNPVGPLPCSKNKTGGPHHRPAGTYE